MGTILGKLEDLWLGLRNLVSRDYSMSGNESTPDPDALEKQTAKFERLSDYVYALLPEDHPEAVVVFFHGLLVDQSEQKHAFWSTWTMRNNNDCWPVTLLPLYLETSAKNKGSDPYRIRVLAVSYEGRTTIPGKTIDEDLTAEIFVQDLVLTEFCRGRGDRDVPIFLVGHDLGGILIKTIIMAVHDRAGREEGTHEKEQLERFLRNLKAVMFYATPHSGSQAIEDKAKAIPVHTRNPMLKLMSVLGADMSRINGDFTRYRAAGGKFKTYAVVPVYNTNQKGFRNEMVVMEASARNDVDEYYSVNADHFQACQPEAIWSNSMTKLGSKIHEEVSGRLTREMEQRFENLRNSLPIGNHGQASNYGMPRLRQGIPQLADPKT